MRLGRFRFSGVGTEVASCSSGKQQQRGVSGPDRGPASPVGHPTPPPAWVPRGAEQEPVGPHVRRWARGAPGRQLPVGRTGAAVGRPRSPVSGSFVQAAHPSSLRVHEPLVPYTWVPSDETGLNGLRPLPLAWAGPPGPGWLSGQADGWGRSSFQSVLRT